MDEESDHLRMRLYDYNGSLMADLSEPRLLSPTHLINFYATGHIVVFVFDAGFVFYNWMDGHILQEEQV